MGQLQKALLQEVKADENQTPKGDPMPVQFNPTSLRLKLTNQSDGGRTRGRQRRQNNGQSSTVLSMDLIFDTGDEGSADEPVSVRTKTNLVEKYVLPKENSSESPPLLRFEWNELIIVGLVESLDIEFDHFAENGAPLRAKMGVSIKEQEPKYAFLEEGKGKKDSNNAQPTGGGDGRTAPGDGTNDTSNNAGSNASSSNRSEKAMEGESAPEFLARQGLDPGAWRGLDVDLSAGLGLEAGVEVGFNSGLSVSAGGGVSVGVLADVGVSLEASLGISGSSVFSASAPSNGSLAIAPKTGSGKKVNGDSAGRVLSTAGGIQSAIESVKIKETQGVISQTQSSFGMSASATVTTSSTSDSAGSVSRVPLSSHQSMNASSASGASSTATALGNPGASVPRADPRSTSFGYGVPLRPLYAAALSQEQVRFCGAANTGQRPDGGPVFRHQKATAPWVALPRRDQNRLLADTAEAGRQKHPCDYVYHPCHCED